MKSICTVSPEEAFKNIEALRGELSQVARRRLTKSSEQLSAASHARCALAWANLHRAIHTPKRG